mmetsp:Transcript_359/g.602  ORF Transcript_359/g.602 Transcript_359/m.602 type:complete len:274 (-) Transcript_359:417-1238(-)
MKFKHIISCLKSPKAHDSTPWDNYFASCKDFDDLEQIFSKNCSCSMLNHPSICNAEADDDKLKFLSQEWEKVGTPRRKGFKSFGHVFNILCHNPTGLFLSGTLSQFNENVEEMMMKLLQHYLEVEVPSAVDLKGGLFNGDRAFELDTSKINAQQFNTTKRNSILPFSFNSCRSQTKDQFIIPETGVQTVYIARKAVNRNHNKELLAYRSGTGSVVLTTSTKKSLHGAKWTVKIALTAEEREFRSSATSVSPFHERIIYHADVVEITKTQGFSE